MNYYEQIKNIIIDTETFDKVKDYSKNRNRVNSYYEIGKLLSEVGSVYGENIIGKYAEMLVNDVGNKYNSKTLYKMRQFYIMFKDEKFSPLGRKLSWSHYRALLPLKDINAIKYYIELCEKHNLTKRDLEERIKTKEYERLPKETKDKLINNIEVSVPDLIPNPIIIYNKNNYNIVSEKVLQRVILEDIDSFLNSLGSGYTYVGHEYKIKLGDKYNYIDLLLFNYEHNAFVVIELKIIEFKKEHIGQINMYMKYIDENIKKYNQNKTIGIIICKEIDKYVIKYCSNESILTRKYLIMN